MKRAGAPRCDLIYAPVFCAGWMQLLQQKLLKR